MSGQPRPRAYRRRAWHPGTVPDTGPADERVRLCRWSAADAGWYAQQTTDPLIRRYTSEPPDLTAAVVAAAIDRVNGDPDLASFLVTDAGTGARLGNIGVHRRGRVGDVSYWVSPGARGTGVATRALRLLVAWAFEALDLAELRLWTHPDNAASQAVAVRAGFRPDPARDRRRTVGGAARDTTAYRLPRPPATPR